MSRVLVLSAYLPWTRSKEISSTISFTILRLLTGKDRKTSSVSSLSVAWRASGRRKDFTLYSLDLTTSLTFRKSCWSWNVCNSCMVLYGTLGSLNKLAPYRIYFVAKRFHLVVETDKGLRSSATSFGIAGISDKIRSSLTDSSFSCDEVFWHEGQWLTTTSSSSPPSSVFSTEPAITFCLLRRSPHFPLLYLLSIYRNMFRTRIYFGTRIYLFILFSIFCHR